VTIPENDVAEVTQNNYMTDKRQLFPAAFFIKRIEFFLTILFVQRRLNHSFSVTAVGFKIDRY